MKTKSYSVRWQWWQEPVEVGELAAQLAHVVRHTETVGNLGINIVVIMITQEKV